MVSAALHGCKIEHRQVKLRRLQAGEVSARCGGSRRTVGSRRGILPEDWAQSGADARAAQPPPEGAKEAEAGVYLPAGAEKGGEWHKKGPFPRSALLMEDLPGGGAEGLQGGKKSNCGISSACR